MSEKRLDYKPQIGYTSDYSSIDGGRSRGSMDVMISSQSNREPLDTSTIPSIKDNLDYLDIIINYLPTGLSRALREVYEPVRDIYYNNLIDKIIDPNLKPPEIIIKPTIPDITIKDPDTPEDDDIPEGEEIHPIILRPINFNDPDDPNPPGDEEDPYEDNTIHPIILLPIQEEETVPGDIDHVYPIILRPIIDKEPTDPDDDPDPDPDDDDDGLWDPPNLIVDVTIPDLKDMVDKEFVFLLGRILYHYTDKLKSSVNNYYFNTLRDVIGQSSENKKFIANKLELTSNDIVNHSKHLFDSSIKNEDLVRTKIDFFSNVFNIKETLTHIHSFLLTNELRKRYTYVDYSVGGSMANSTSDFTLKQLNVKYEQQYRKSFENLFRYLESSMKVTDDILRLYIQDRSNKSTLLKKGGIK